MAKFEISVDQKYVVFDKLVLSVEANNEEEALELAQMGEYELLHSEEIDRDYEETFWNEAFIEERNQNHG
jgi:hypothetical protein